MRARVLLSPTSTPCLISLQPHTHIYIYISCEYIYIYRQRNLSPHADACPRVSSSSLSTLLRIACTHVYTRIRLLCVCVGCGDRSRCEETAERTGETGTGLSSAQGKTGLEHGGSRTMGARLSLPLFVPSLCNPLSLSLLPPSSRSFSALRAPSARVLSSSLARPPRFSVPFPPR